MYKIPFNKPFLTGKEAHYIYQAVYSGKISGDGVFTRKCQEFFESRFGFLKTFLTTSCTDALEMASLLCRIIPGDEVIVPSFTFVSTANAFEMRGAKIRFAESRPDEPNLDVALLEELITERTKAIVPVHYAGVACEMELIMQLAEKHNLFVIEDAAQAVDSYYFDKPLGGIGHFGAFSFHETKNLTSGEGGMLSVNRNEFKKRAEIIWEKGTNRSAFWRGEVDKYGWVDVGSSFLPSEIVSAFLFAQIEYLEQIQNKRKEIWNFYNLELASLQKAGNLKLPYIPSYASNNAHMFYVVTNNVAERDGLLTHLKNQGIYATFHYQTLHKSSYFEARHDGRELKNADMFADCLIRLPMYYELSREECQSVVQSVKSFYN